MNETNVLPRKNNIERGGMTHGLHSTYDTSASFLSDEGKFRFLFLLSSLLFFLFPSSPQLTLFLLSIPCQRHLAERLVRHYKKGRKSAILWETSRLTLEGARSGQESVVAASWEEARQISSAAGEIISFLLWHDR